MCSERKFDLYYVIPESDIASLTENEKVGLKLTQKVPKRIAQKIRTIQSFLTAAGVTWSMFGYVINGNEYIQTASNVQEYSLYAITAKGQRPPHFDKFLEFVIQLEIPKSIFHPSILKEIKRINQSSKELKKLAGRKRKHDEDEAREAPETESYSQ